MPSREVHPALRPYVGSMVGYRDHLDPRTVHHGLPAPTVTVIVAFDAPLDVGWLDRSRERAPYWTCAAGLHTRPALIRTHGFQHGIQLALTPRGARRLLGLPAGALAAHLVAHDDLPGGIGADVHAALSAAEDWQARFALLERHLVALLARSEESRPVAPELAEAWRLLLVTQGRVRVADLAARLGWSRRRLLERFRAEYGVGPKEAARIVRFDHTRRLVDGGKPLAEAAYAGGFADQAHLAREWSALAGRTPSQLRASAYHVT